MANSKSKTTNKRLAVSANGSAHLITSHGVDMVKLRLFEPQRKDVTLTLDTNVVGLVKNYTRYLEESYGQMPLENKVYELLLEESLMTNQAFQTWLSRLPAEKKNTAVASSDDLLEVSAGGSV